MPSEFAHSGSMNFVHRTPYEYTLSRQYLYIAYAFTYFNHILHTKLKWTDIMIFIYSLTDQLCYSNVSHANSTKIISNLHEFVQGSDFDEFLLALSNHGNHVIKFLYTVFGLTLIADAKQHYWNVRINTKLRRLNVAFFKSTKW